jgi:DNA repair and recombination protein RAD52
MTSAPGEAVKTGVQSRQMPPPDQMQTVQGCPRPASGGVARETSNGKNGQQAQQFDPQPHSSNTRLARSNSGPYNGGYARAQPDANSAARHLQAASSGTGRVLNQPSRTGAASDPHSPAKKQTLSLSGGEESPENGLPAIQSGFFSARAATLLPAVPGTEGPPPVLPGNLPTFNPHAESPSIRRTPGIDHSATKPLSKDLKHVTGGTQAVAGASPAPLQTNIINPQLDATRKIGAPGSPSLMANRGSYRPPTMKRPLQQPNLARPPLGDIPANGITSGPDGGGDMKRPRLSGSLV